MKHYRFFVGSAFAAIAYTSLSSAQARGTLPVEACLGATAQQIENLVEDWNKAVQTGDPELVVALYAEQSALLPTFSARPKLTHDEKIDYFSQFLLLQPVGRIDSSWVKIDCNSALNTGLYTFTLKDGRAIKARYTFTYEYDNDRWKITSHHSSVVPQ